MEHKEILEKAIEKYGDKNQLLKTIEELNELSRALARFLIDDNIYNYANVIEEIVDVKIMLEQTITILNLGKETLDSIKQEKIDRLKQNLNI